MLCGKITAEGNDFFALLIAAVRPHFLSSASLAGNGETRNRRGRGSPAIAKTKTANVFVEFLIAESDGEFGRPDVAGFHENVFDAEIGERGVIVERGAAVVPKSLLAKDVGIESELVLVERGCRRDDFE